MTITVMMSDMFAAREAGWKIFKHFRTCLVLSVSFALKILEMKIFSIGIADHSMEKATRQVNELRDKTNGIRRSIYMKKATRRISIRFRVWIEIKRLFPRTEFLGHQNFTMNEFNRIEPQILPGPPS